MHDHEAATSYGTAGDRDRQDAAAEREAQGHFAAEPEQDSWWSALRPLVLRMHFYGGVLIAPFLLIAATTGLLYVFTPQLEQLVYDHELHVPPVQTAQPVASQIESAQAALPRDALKSVRPGPTPTDTTQVIFNAPDRPDSFYRTVFVDPHTSAVRGVLETYGTAQSLPVRTWFDQLHQRLHLGEPGRLYSELAASWLWVVALGGVLLWLSRWRRARRLRSVVAPKLRPAGRGRIASWHGAVGLWAAIGFAFLSATGLTWSLNAGETVTELRSTLGGETPEVSTTLPPTSPAMPDVGIDRVMQSARGYGLSDPVEITPPSGPGEAYTVQQIQRHWPEKQDSAAVDPSTGQVTEVLRFADYPLMAKLSRWGIDAHMGLLFGWVNQLVLGLLATALICMIFWGYRMWWLRRPTGGSDLAFGSAPARGGWQRVPGKVLAPVILITVLVGYAFPLLGASLVLFLGIDIVRGVLARRRAARNNGIGAS